MPPPLAGVKQVYPGRYEPDVLLNLIKTEGVTFSHCVPTILHMLLTCRPRKDVDLSRWKVVIGGAALPQRARQGWRLSAASTSLPVMACRRPARS